MIACLKNEDALSQFLRRNASNTVGACLNNCDILSSHGVGAGDEVDASLRTPIHHSTEQAGYPVELTHRTDGLPASVSQSRQPVMVPMPPNETWGGVRGAGCSVLSPKKIGGIC